MNTIIALALIAILIALAFAGRALLMNGKQGEPKSKRMAKALAWRVGLSIGLFVFILVSYKLGWINPTGIPVGR